MSVRPRSTSEPGAPPSVPTIPRARLKTFSHLGAARRMPTAYEIATTGLRYDATRGLQTRSPIGDWLERHQRGSALSCADWDQFTDPRETTYCAYVARRGRQEAFVDGLFASIDAQSRDESLGPSAIEGWSHAIAPLRFPWHALQMAAAYVGQFAPGGRVTVTAAFQAADEVRRIQRVAYRLAQLRRIHPSVAVDARARWQEGAAWQPLRRLVETLLVAWDWGEAFVALNLCVKPLLDDIAMIELPSAMAGRGDALLGELFFSLHEDARWQREWTAAFLASVISQRAENRSVIERWLSTWISPAAGAISAFATTFTRDVAPVVGRVKGRYAAQVATLGLDVDLSAFDAGAAG